MAIKRICDNCEQGQHGMCRYSAHPTPCPDFEIASRFKEAAQAKKRSELRNTLILRYAILLIHAGERNLVGAQAARIADSVIEALDDEE